MGIKITSDWTRIIEYPDNHLNDFCLFKGLDGKWHGIGIMGTGTWASETSLFHCSSPELLGPYEKHPPLLEELSQGNTANNAPQKHAPFVVIKDQKYHLFFRRPPGTNILVNSSDSFNWSFEPKVIFEENDARDTCIQKFDDIYCWYYCQWGEIDSIRRSCILLRQSRDLLNWSDAVPVHIDTSREVSHSHLESPFVIKADGYYWLFIRDRSKDEKCITTVFKSEALDDFSSENNTPLAELEGVHAPELIQADGRWYITRVSGPPDHLKNAPLKGGWIEIAELSFNS